MCAVCTPCAAEQERPSLHGAVPEIVFPYEETVICKEHILNKRSSHTNTTKTRSRVDW